MQTLTERCGGTLGTLDQAISEMHTPRIKLPRPTPSYKGQLTLGNPEEYESAMSIDIERYPRTMQAKAPAASNFVIRSQPDPASPQHPPNLDGPNSQPDHKGDFANVKFEKGYEVKDESAPEGKRQVSRDDLAKGYEYGRTAVHISASDETVTQYEVNPCLEIVGFVPKDNVSLESYRSALMKLIPFHSISITSVSRGPTSSFLSARMI